MPISLGFDVYQSSLRYEDSNSLLMTTCDTLAKDKPVHKSTIYLIIPEVHIIVF